MARGQLNFLQLANRALQRLGKTQLGDFTGAVGDSWGGLVRDFINDAQAEVSKEHDWSTLYDSGTFTSSSRIYDLSTAFSDFGREIDLICLGTGGVLTAVSQRDLDAEDPDQAQSGAPERYSIQYPDLTFNRTPTAVNFRLRYLQRPTPLSVETDTSLLPEYCDLVLVWWTVWQLGASREDNQDRGETARDIYEKSLARAIGQDRRRMDRLLHAQPLFAGGGGGRPPVNPGPHYAPA
jgi:hypothetical protein